MFDALYLLATLETARPQYLAAPPQQEIILAALGLRGHAFARGFSGGSTEQCPGGCPPDPEPDPVDPSADAGAVLPITYTVGDLGGTPRYVHPSGDVSTGCTGANEAGACSTITQANSAATAGDPIILLSGTYTAFGNTTNGTSWTGTQQFVTKNNTELWCETGGTCTIDGSTSILAASGTTEGSYTYKTYTPRPCPSASSFGVNYCNNDTALDNVNGTPTASPYNVGKWLDQAWLTSTPYPTSTALQEVVRKDDLATGKFWVDRTQTSPGTASVSNNSRNITGTNTNFTVLFKVGDSITLGGQTKTIDQITSNTAMRVSVNFSPAVTGGTLTRNGNNRIYFLTADLVGATELAVCNLGDFLQWSGTNGWMRGITIKRYCNSQDNFAMLDINSTSDGFRMSDVVIEECSSMCVAIAGGASAVLEDLLIERVTCNRTNWMCFNVNYTDSMEFDSVRITNGDPWDEYSSAPNSGAIKTSKTCGMWVHDSFIGYNRSQSFWMDESNNSACRIQKFWNNTVDYNGQSGEDTGVFFEISDKIKIYNNKIRCFVSTTCLKVAGSTGVEIWNNTIIGGMDVLGIYADTRSRLNCAQLGTLSSGPACPSPYLSSNRWVPTQVGIPTWPNTMDWLTRVDVIRRNIIAYPTGTSNGLCSAVTVICVFRHHPQGQTGGTPVATLTLRSMLHVAEPGRSIPETSIDCNVIAFNPSGSSGPLWRVESPTTTGTFTSYTTLAAFNAAMDDASPFPTLEFEEHSLEGSAYVDSNGAPTAALDDLHDDMDASCAFPTDTDMNDTIAAGNEHYGVLWQ